MLLSLRANYAAYGQTGSGKTHTMMGPPDNRELWGVNRRAVAELFDTCAKRTDAVFALKVLVCVCVCVNLFDYSKYSFKT